jgi:RimJ/RimL family protein N-acetyltransferase
MNPMTHDIELRDVTPEDLPVLFEHQLDPEANQMAAFPARDREAFMAHWAKILRDATGTKKAIWSDGRLAGNIVGFQQSGETLIGYWLGKEYWGKGIATKALAAFLEQFRVRPLFAHVAKHNVGSIRVLEKCGFTLYREQRDSVRGQEVDELILILGGSGAEEARG